jgi:putative sigma-54 modulation protein
MQIHTTCRHGKLTPAVRRFLEERLAKLERFAFVSEAHVILESVKYRHTAEVLLKTRKKELIAREESSDQTGAIDAAIDRLERQLKRLKERTSTRILHDGTRTNGDERRGAKRSAARLAIATEPAAPDGDEGFADAEEVAAPPRPAVRAAKPAKAAKRAKSAKTAKAGGARASARRR